MDVGVGQAELDAECKPMLEIKVDPRLCGANGSRIMGGPMVPGRPSPVRAKAAIAYGPVRFSHLPRDGPESGVRDVRSPRSLAAPGASCRSGS